MTIENSSSAGKLTVPISLDEIDKNLAAAGLSKSFDLAIDPAIFMGIRNVPMLESAIIQWISTLWRSAHSDAFEIGQVGEDTQQLKHLAASAPGAVLALFPAGKIKGVNRRSAAAFKKQFFEQQKRWPDLAVSHSALLLCLDSYENGGLPHQLYSDLSTGNVTDWDGFRLFVDKLIKSVVEESNVRGEILNRADSISTILFELFKNTHDHARLNIDGSVINDSLRGIYSHFYSLKDISDHLNKTNASPENADALNNYLRFMLKPMNEKRHGAATKRDLSGFLELSVFDTGPGMAAKWLGCEITNCDAKEQYDAIINCLSKGNSSSETRGRGFGLWRVLRELIQVKGFIRIRTNKVHVFRQFAILEGLHKVHHADGHETPQERFTDWR
ncbi:MAG: hypothetical protein WC216_12160, partial [Gallionella sp.]